MLNIQTADFNLVRWNQAGDIIVDGEYAAIDFFKILCWRADEPRIRSLEGLVAYQRLSWTIECSWYGR